ncbi:MAG: energy transducer TonB [Bacteroides sp.]|nr:energy transducer TonB [Bacteroides sp.]
MRPKKSNKASLENKRAANFTLGLIITLSLILISFEWTRSVDVQSDLSKASEIQIQDFIIDVIPREIDLPAKPKLPPIAKVIEIVTDEPDLPSYEDFTEFDDNTWVDYPTPLDDIEKLQPEPEFFYIVEDMPLFNGGDPNTEFVRFIFQHLKYPEIAAENGVEGMVIVQFDIDKNGKLVNPVILRGVDPALDAESIRVVRLSPKWTPGKQREKAVKVRYVFPIKFDLQ